MCQKASIHLFAHKPVSLGRGIYDLKSGCSMLRVPKKNSTPLELEDCLSPAAIFFSKKKAYHTSTIVHRREETICLPGPCAHPAEAQARIVLLYPLPFSMSIESLEVCDSSSLPNILHTGQVMLLPCLSQQLSLVGSSLPAHGQTSFVCWGLARVGPVHLEVSVLAGWSIFC